MLYRKQRILCGIISCLMMVSTLLSFGYCVGRSNASQEIPYGLTNNYIKLKYNGTDKVDVQGIIDVDRDNNIIIISEYTNKNYIALYDPSYYFYNQKMIDIIGTTRYFSNTDYKSKTRTGILVSDNPDIYRAYSNLENQTTPLIDRMLFSINPLSTLYNSNIDYIVNQTSIESMGDIVYIDSMSSKSINIMKEKLLLIGYKNESKPTVNLFTVCVSVLLNGLYEKVILLPSLALYLIFLFTCFMYFLNNKYILTIHRLHGGSLFRIFLSFSKRFLFINLVFSLIIMLISILILKNDYLVYYNYINYMQIYIFHVSTTTLSYFLAFYMNFHKKGEGVYVK